MATVTHLAVGLAAGRRVASLEPAARPFSTLAWFGALAVAPDLDLLVRHLELTPALVHRAATHSLFVACVAGALLAALVRPRGVPRWRAIAWAIPVLASHGLLDFFTGGGRGIELFWPFTAQRFASPVRLIPGVPAWPEMVSPLGLTKLAEETALCLPLLVYALWPRRAQGRAPTLPPQQR